MEISQLAIKIMFLCLPGVIFFLIYNSLVGKRTQSDLEMFLLVFFFSIVSYFPVGLIKGVINLYNGAAFEVRVHNINLFFTENGSPAFGEMFWASIVSIFLSYFFSYLYNRKSINLIARKIGVSNRFGDEDVWHFFHNADPKEKNDGWIFVRDHKQNLVYYGSITYWSESEKERELIISEVSVFSNDDSEKLYEMDHIYICRAKDDLTLEVPKFTPEENSNSPKPTENKSEKEKPTNV